MCRHAIRLVITAALGLFTAAPLLAGNLIYNGDFTPYNGDTPITSISAQSMCGPYSYCIGYHNSTVGEDYIGAQSMYANSWMLLPNPPSASGYADVMVVGSNYTEPNFSQGGTLHFDPVAGTNQSLDITGEGNQGANGVKQTVTTVAGQWYDLSFYLGHQWDQASGYDVGPAAVTLWIDGQEIALFQNDASTNVDDISWAMENYKFQAGSDSTTITFINATNSQNQYAGLDDVSLVGVPEPATFVLLVTGLAGFLLLLPRRQKIALLPLRTSNRE